MRAVVALCLSCWSCGGDGGHCEPPDVPGAFVNQPRGAGCRSVAECAQGLDCIVGVCATPCAAGCADACVQGACLQRCTDDSTCDAGATSGQCIAFSEPVCMPRLCFAAQTCPAGYQCVGASRWTGDMSGAGGVGGPYCPTTGFCQLIQHLPGE